ncbi:MAG: FAD-dependent oxidoreductase, partial [Anaerolineae bacterium]
IDPLREGQPLEGLSLNNLVGNWPPALRALFIGLARNGLSAVPEEIPLSGFLAFLRFYTLLRRDAWAFSYLPADGGTCLVEPLAARVRGLGGAIQMGRRVTQLEHQPEGWRVHLAQGDPLSVQASQVILATDAPNTAVLLQSNPTLAASQGRPGPDLYWPRGMATAVVRIWFDRAPRAGAEAGIFSGDCVIDNFFWLHRIQDPYIRWHRATGGSAVEVHVYGPPEVLDLPDTMLLARAIVDVLSAFPELRGHEIRHLLRRNEPTHTLFGLGPAGRHLGIETPWPGLYCCGDWVRHPSPSLFMERATVTGIEAANAVLRARGLPEWTLLPYPEPEPLAGSIERLMFKGRQAMRRRRRA